MGIFVINKDRLNWSNGPSNNFKFSFWSYN